MALAAKLYRSDDDRQAARVPVVVDATLRDPANAPLDAIVLDISTTGFRATVPIPLPPGSVVRLGLAGLGVNPATVIWQSGAVIGCRFETPIPYEGIARAQSTETVVDGVFAGTAIDAMPAAAQPAAQPRRMMAAGMPFPIACAVSTVMSVGWGAAMIRLVQTALMNVFP